MFKVILLFFFTVLVEELSTVAPSILYTIYLQTDVLLTWFTGFLLPGSAVWERGWAEEPDEVSACPGCPALPPRECRLGQGVGLLCLCLCVCVWEGGNNLISGPKLGCCCFSARGQSDEIQHGTGLKVCFPKRQG